MIASKHEYSNSIITVDFGDSNVWSLESVNSSISSCYVLAKKRGYECSTACVRKRKATGADNSFDNNHINVLPTNLPVITIHLSPPADIVEKFGWVNFPLLRCYGLRTSSGRS